MLSNYLAEIWGILIVAASMALLIKDGHLKKLFSKIETEENIFFWGLGCFAVGTAMILAHNLWVNDWRVVITLIGWLSMLKGFFMLFLTEHVKVWSKKMESCKFLPYALVIAVFVGLVLTYLGFKA